MYTDAVGGQVGQRAQGDAGVDAGQCRVLADVVDVGEVDNRPSRFGDGDGRDGRVDLPDGQCATQAVEGHVAELDLDAQPFAQQAGQGYVEAVQLERLGVEGEGRVVGRRADDEPTALLDGGPGVGRRGGGRGGGCGLRRGWFQRRRDNRLLAAGAQEAEQQHHNYKVTGTNVKHDAPLRRKPPPFGRGLGEGA